MQLPCRRQIEQFLIRNASPEEKRQSRGELEIIDRFGPFAPTRSVIEIEKLRRGDRAGGDRLHRLGELDPGLEAATTKSE